MTCIHIHGKIFGFKTNPQNTVTLSALRCNGLQPLMRYFCQMKLMMPASKQTPCLAHLKHSAFPRWAPVWIMQNVNPAERLSLSEGECCQCVVKPTQALYLNAPKPSQHLTPTTLTLSNTTLWARTAVWRDDLMREMGNKWRCLLPEM